MNRRRFGHWAAALAALGTGACSPLTVLNALTPAGSYRVIAGQAFGDGPRRKLDVYIPLGAKPVGGFPLVVFFYGGSWHSGNRKDYEFVGEALTARGIAVAIADYRLYPEVTYPEFLRDNARAVAFAVRHAAEYDANAQSVFVMGHSAGAYNAAMIALDSRWLEGEHMKPEQLAGWVGLAGAYDFLPATDPAVKAAFHEPATPKGSQPIEHVSPRSPRAFLGTGRSDSVVSVDRNTLAMAAALRRAGVAVTLEVYERPGHATLIGTLAPTLRWMAPVLDDIEAFVHARPK